MASLSEVLNFTDRFRPWILAGLVLFILSEILLFSPTSVDSWGPNSAPQELDPADLAAGYEEDNKALGYDAGQIPEYSVSDLEYTSTTKGRREWKLSAKRGYLHNAEKLVLARDAVAMLYNPDGQATLITGSSARYFMDKKDLEIFGNVTTQFPDGFRIYSDYVHYHPNNRQIIIPTSHQARGEGLMDDGARKMHFTSQGLNFTMGDNQVLLPENVVFVIEPAHKTADNNKELTTIESDSCQIDRQKKLANFVMSPLRPSEEAFVNLRQPTMHVKSRWMVLDYGGEAKKKQNFQYLTAYQDVFLQEKSSTSNTRYGTSGKAAFESDRNVIVMTQYPQLYQDNDTVTGDVIIMHRDSDIVEVEKSNAFNQGDTP